MLKRIVSVSILLLVAAAWRYGATKSVTLPIETKVEIDKSKLDSAATMLNNMQQMNAFGSRTTGSEGHNQFITWLKQQLEKDGHTIYSDHYVFDRWEEQNSGITIGHDTIHVSSAFPYSGETPKEGVTGELVYTDPNHYEAAKGKIAVVDIHNFEHFPVRLIMNMRESIHEPNGISPNVGDLVLTTALKKAHLEKAKEQGVLAVILVWNGVSHDKVQQQYLPFTEDYAGIPAVWVDSSEGQRVIKAAKQSQSGTVTLQADVQPSAPTESFYVKIEGKNDKESILINTHTDGVNAIEENGAIAMLSMIRYLQQEQPERTLIFAFVTGHFRLPVFGGTSQATSTWMQAHPELWDGQDGHRKAVAGVTVEHLGSMEWTDHADGQYGPTGKISTEFTYAGNKPMAAIWKKAIEDRTNTRTVILRGHNKFQFGESQPLFEAGIPMIGLIPMPDYLTVNSENQEMDKFNVHLMYEQIHSLLKAVRLIDQTDTEALGEAERYSFFLGNTR